MLFLQEPDSVEVADEELLEVTDEDAVDEVVLAVEGTSDPTADPLPALREVFFLAIIESIFLLACIRIQRLCQARAPILGRR